MIIRKLVLGLTVLVLMTGCKTTFQSNWRNFNAYYNTYYNAKKNYNSGLKKNLNQTRDYNPLQPIRIHPKPVNAGAQDFDKAIEKGADILRKYDDTKWVDDALALIGKSYYYKREYFSADQKFKELYINSEDRNKKQESVIWQGRVLLDLEAYSEGIAYLSEQLTLSDEEGWEVAKRAEIKALLAQHYVKLNNWKLAADELTEALPDLKKKEYRERGYFLLGQIHEELENPEAAFEAYNQVQNHYTEYRVQYLAYRKKAEVARDLGRHDVAFQIFEEMVRDDKNLEYKAELDYELARTEYERENFKRAEQLFQNVLQNRLHQPPPEIRARAYYGLAEIHRHWHDNFSMAAVYYDSAAQVNVSAEKLPGNFRAIELAESFGNYSRIKSEIALQDSLLRLGQLSPEEFDSVLVVLKKQKAEELKQLREERQEQQNQLITVNEEEEQDATNLRNGFLNSTNPVLQENARQQFFAIWGDRPLTDNWRVRSMIRYSQSSDEDAAERENLPTNTENGNVVNIQIDLSDIPFTPEDQDSVRKQIAALKYELGNMFFLSLDMPDSAVYYFEKAIENPSTQNVNTVSMYSLTELYSIQEKEEMARSYAQRLIDQYPNTEYARRVSEKFSIPLEQTYDLDAVDPVQLYKQISSSDTVNALQKAKRLKAFSFSFSSHRIAPQALFEALEGYVEAGREDSAYKSNIDDWRQMKQNWSQQLSEFKVEQDTAKSALQDTTISEEQRTKFQALVDSTLQEPNFQSVFPYISSNWDSARVVADTFLVMFRDSKLRPKVSRINQELTVPERKETEADQEMENESEITTPSEGYRSCSELNAKLEIRGGLQNFLSTIQLPEDIALEEISYLFKVNQRGIVDNFELQTEDVPEELASEFEQAFGNLNFEPVLNEGQAIAVECRVSFPISGQ